MSAREARHTYHPAPKEVFEHPSYNLGTGDYGYIQLHHGSDVDAADEGCLIEIYVPHDFKKVESLTILIIPRGTGPRVVTVDTTYGKVGELCNYNAEGPITYTLNAVLNTILELHIESLVDEGPLEAGDLLAIRLLTGAANTLNGLVVGARLKYV